MEEYGEETYYGGDPAAGAVNNEGAFTPEAAAPA